MAWPAANRSDETGWFRRQFSPTIVPGLVGWYKADGTLWQDSARTTPVVANSDPVGAWDDASGNNNHLLQATAGKRPLYKVNILGGKPAVLFDGLGTFVSIA